MTKEAEAIAMDSERLRAVEVLFQQQIAEGLHPGGSLAVDRHGRPVLELDRGVGERESTRPVTPETLFVLFSSTKPLAAVCLHILLERGRFELDDPVARYWPEFSRNGKAAGPLRHVLTHSGGVPPQPPHPAPPHW